MGKHNINADFVRAIPLFSRLSDIHLEELAASSQLREEAARTVLFREGDRPTSLYTVISGAVELYSEHDDRCSTIAVVHAMRTFKLRSVFGLQNALSARVLEPSTLLAAPARLISGLFARDPAFALVFMESLASECQEIIEDFKNYRMRSTTERVAHWMLCCDGKNGLTGRFVIPFDKRVLASYLGMAPEHLSRSFSALSSVGVVVNGRSITLKDRAALSVAAGPGAPDYT